MSRNTDLSAPYAMPVAELWIEIPDGWGACTGSVLVGVRYQTPDGERDILVAKPVNGLSLVVRPLGLQDEEAAYFKGLVNRETRQHGD